jgi:Zn-dependent M28 family amino/carboxypeptidase
MAAAVFLIVVGCLIMLMPGRSYRGPLPPLTTDQAALRDELRRDVVMLAAEIGERNVVCLDALNDAADFIETALRDAGYQVERQAYEVAGKTCYNLAVEITGDSHPDEIIIVGAHYDSVLGCPGANDNGSAVAAMLGLARRFAGKPCQRTLRFVAFANEEPPHFWTDDMGSLVYAKRCRTRGENIIGMISLETIGYYSDQKGSQNYPPPFSFFYPSTGDFVAFVGNLKSRRFVRDVVRSFRRHAKFPSEGAALPELIREAGWSDHWSFWQQGYPALMVTDTAPFRYPYYHLPEDTPDKIDYERLARVVAALEMVLRDLSQCRKADRK